MQGRLLIESCILQLFALVIRRIGDQHPHSVLVLMPGTAVVSYATSGAVAVVASSSIATGWIGDSVGPVSAGVVGVGVAPALVASPPSLPARWPRSAGGHQGYYSAAAPPRHPWSPEPKCSDKTAAPISPWRSECSASSVALVTLASPHVIGGSFSVVLAGRSCQSVSLISRLMSGFTSTLQLHSQIHHPVLGQV